MADIDAARRLVGAGMIEITGQLRPEKRISAVYAVHVRQITAAGLSAIAAENGGLAASWGSFGDGAARGPDALVPRHFEGSP